MENNLFNDQIRITDNMDDLLNIFPRDIKDRIILNGNVLELLEVVLDLGRQLEIRFIDKTVRFEDILVTQEDIDNIVNSVGDFGDDNRAGIERTLHRISAIRNRKGKIIGVTCRVGRAIYGTIDIIRDIIEKNKSILILGKPGIGKTTKLREIARILSDEFNKRVIVIDTSNEIAGDGDIPHSSIGHARRMQVSTPLKQESVMIEAVENHMPEVVVIDEISTEAEALAARTIAERGVMLVATAHGQTLENLVINPSLSDLVGGIQTVTLSDDEAARRGTQKSVLERMSQPTFDIIIEIPDINKVAIHKDAMRAVDGLLRGNAPRPEIRVRNTSGAIKIVQHEQEAYYFEDNELVSSDNNLEIMAPYIEAPRSAVMKILPYGISRNRLEKAIITLNVPAKIVRHHEDCDLVITVKNYDNKSDYSILKELKERKIPVYVIRSNTTAQVTAILKEIFNVDKDNNEQDAIDELKKAIEILERLGGFQDLSPQNAYIRRAQHHMATELGYKSESIGNEPYRRLRIFEKEKGSKQNE